MVYCNHDCARTCSGRARAVYSEPAVPGEFPARCHRCGVSNGDWTGCDSARRRASRDTSSALRATAIAGAVPAIDSQAMTINTVIGANLRAPAKVTASVDNGADSPLPIARVDLQMRERRLCFEARPDTSYTLRYGDAELSAPSYGYARRFVSSARPTMAALGPEEKNPNYVPPGADKEQRRPGRELPWLLLIAGDRGRGCDGPAVRASQA